MQPSQCLCSVNFHSPIKPRGWQADTALVGGFNLATWTRFENSKMYNQTLQNNCTKTFPGGLKQKMSNDRQVSLYSTPALPNTMIAAASPNCPVSSYQGQNLNHWQGMRSTFVFCLSATVWLLPSETKVKLTGHLDFSEGNSILTSKSQSQNSSDEEQSLDLKRALQPIHLFSLRGQRYCRQGALQGLNGSSTRAVHATESIH